MPGLQGHFPLVSAVCLIRLRFQRVGAFVAGGFAAYGSRCEENRFKIQIKSGTHSVRVIDIVAIEVDVADAVNDSYRVTITARRAQPPIIYSPISIRSFVESSNPFVYIIRFLRRKRPQKDILDICISCYAVYITAVIITMHKRLFDDCSLFSH